MTLKNTSPVCQNISKPPAERPILNGELQVALKRSKAGKSRGNEGLPVDFYSCLWNIIEATLMNMYKECTIKKEMPTTMKQGLITLLPEPNKDRLSIEN